MKIEILNNHKLMHVYLKNCPGFGQDRVNFTGIQEGAQPGGLTQPQPGQTEPGVPYHVPSCRVPVGGEGAVRQETPSRLGSTRRQSGREQLCSAGSVLRFVLCIPLFCIVFLFPLFAVLLNCPYPDPPVSACFFPFSSAPRWGEGRPLDAFIAGCNQTIQKPKNVPKKKTNPEVPPVDQ